MTKDELLDVAELIDTFRVVPRLLVFLYAWFVYAVTFYILAWYFAQPKEGRGTQETAVILGVFTAITGLAGIIFKVYTDNGRDWSPKPPPPAATITATTTVAPP